MDQKILNELVEGILDIIGNKAVRIVLYGLVARNTATVESDVDIALIMKGSLNSELENQLSDFIVDLNLKYDKVFSVIDIDDKIFRKWSSLAPFYKNVESEGKVLYSVA